MKIRDFPKVVLILVLTVATLGFMLTPVQAKAASANTDIFMADRQPTAPVVEQVTINSERDASFSAEPINLKTDNGSTTEKITSISSLPVRFPPARAVKSTFNRSATRNYQHLKLFMPYHGLRLKPLV